MHVHTPVLSHSLRVLNAPTANSSPNGQSWTVEHDPVSRQPIRNMSYVFQNSYSISFHSVLCTTLYCLVQGDPPGPNTPQNCTTLYCFVQGDPPGPNTPQNCTTLYCFVQGDPPGPNTSQNCTTLYCLVQGDPLGPNTSQIGTDLYYKKCFVLVLFRLTTSP